MGKLGRFACIFTPMVLTIGALLCLGLAFSGQLNKNSSLQNDLYFFKANLQDFTSDPDNPDIVKEANDQIDNELLQALQSQAKTNGDLKDFYQVGLFGYCSGTIDDKTKKETVEFCSPRKTGFYFDPIEVWGLNNTSVQVAFPKEMTDGLNAYRKVAKWMFAAYATALGFTAGTILVGISALFSRWGSLITTIVQTLQCLFFFGAATTSTAVYASLVGVFETVMKQYNIHSGLGKNMLIVVWFGVALSLAANLFWTISICCCSGASAHKKTVVEKTPYTYERVASPYLGASGNNSHQMHPVASGGHGTSGSAYEPFRQQHV
ncbi:hypothetical protein K491DRAFT_495259 [Lophiostoma macrostomum CBS 122681]|uniref:Integral membrane protein-like protein n=1 Tax=Lophiostoma macrostomum CBS 122681 TaxID=1314788 RepID=A0A6A6T1I0_9PLEO|nr:hypothetical protein K491DRAFT_495259 [Lophiostoma macrostomum CBS 122681]